MLATASEIVDAIKKSNYKYPKFVQLNKLWGCKMWYIKHYKESSMQPSGPEQERDNNHRMQAHAASYGLAPAVGEKFSFVNPHDEDCYVYGFLTVICPRLLHKEPEYQHLSWGWYFWEFFNVNKYWKKQKDSDDINNIDFEYYGLPNLANMLLDIGFEYAEDLHLENVGFMADGSFVCIDFDHCYLPPNPITKADKLLAANELQLALG